jgi:arsenite methyltransferase
MLDIKQLQSEFTLDSLNQDYHEISKFIDFEYFLDLTVDNVISNRYYLESLLWYMLVHSLWWSIHMAINTDGIFHVDWYIYQPDHIYQLIQKNQCKHVCELGCGTGFNLKYIRKRDKSIFLHWIDLSSVNCMIWRLRNPWITIINWDFTSTWYKSNSFDLVYGIETLCYSKSADSIMKEMYRILKPWGIAVIFDWFNDINNQKNIDEVLSKSTLLFQKSMVVEFQTLNNRLSSAKSQWFEIEDSKNLSQYVIPNLLRLYAIAKKSIHWWVFSKLLYKVSPRFLAGNALAWIFGIYTILYWTTSYNMLTLRKPSNL